MSLPYVKFTHEEAIRGKKETLSSQIDILTLIKKIGAYKRLRKLEISRKITLKSAVRHEIIKINSLLREMPEIDSQAAKEIGLQKEKLDKSELTKNQSLEAELKEIRDKLDRLER